MDAARERLLRAAREVFDEEGFRGATTRRIAARAGVNEVTLFRHFASKEELIGAALEWGHGEAMARLGAAALPVIPRDLDGDLRPFLRSVLRAFAASNRGVRTAMAEWEHLPSFRGWLLGPSEAVAAELGRYLVAAQAAGLMRGEVDALAVTHVLLATLFWHGLMPSMLPERFAGGAEVSMERCIDVVIDAIRRPPEGEEVGS
ncbi:helix-turn-helix domain-containing protein [Tepidiforma sp.]|uniref:TetR/AcrR family transcriptional regulator n=1 Tax=Tepidiforma sp. TaxID=2682230 RepID=UPI002ADDF033|nr:helix-turn-helix domain-containing protein [Tepidiforma sp.]